MHVPPSPEALPSSRCLVTYVRTAGSHLARQEESRLPLDDPTMLSRNHKVFVEELTNLTHQVSSKGEDGSSG